MPKSAKVAAWAESVASNVGSLRAIVSFWQNKLNPEKDIGVILINGNYAFGRRNYQIVLLSGNNGTMPRSNSPDVEDRTIKTSVPFAS
jgi:hypothetical protein